MTCTVSSNVLARGYAANARDIGLSKHIKGFEIGGKLRKLANTIVHAPVGQAHKHAKIALNLSKLANQKKK
jgi:hypothetical protein